MVLNFGRAKRLAAGREPAANQTKTIPQPTATIRPSSVAVNSVRGYFFVGREEENYGSSERTKRTRGGLSPVRRH